MRQLPRPGSAYSQTWANENNRIIGLSLSNIEERVKFNELEIDNLQAAVFMYGTVSPATLAAGGIANWTTAGFATATFLRLTANAAGTNLTGMEAGQSNQVKVIANLGSGNLILNHEAGSSTSTNRFLCSGGTDRTIATNGMALLVYDGISTRWRVLD